MPQCTAAKMICSVHGSRVIQTTLNKASMFIVRKSLIFKEKVKTIFPSKKNLIRMKTNNEFDKSGGCEHHGRADPFSTVYSGKIQCRIFQWVPIVTKSWSLPSRSLMEGGNASSVNLITQISHSNGIIEAGMLVRRKH